MLARLQHMYFMCSRQLWQGLPIFRSAGLAHAMHFETSDLSHMADYLCVIASLFPAGVGVQVTPHVLDLLLQLLHCPRLQAGWYRSVPNSHTIVKVSVGDKMVLVLTGFSNSFSKARHDLCARMPRLDHVQCGVEGFIS